MHTSGSCLVAAALGLLLLVPATGQDAAKDVDYAAQIEPLLRQNCHKCHGP